VRERALVPVASVSTRRVVRRLRSPEGTALAEVVDDTVIGRPLPTGAELRWREWQVGLLDGDEDLLRAVHLHLLSAGATPSGTASELGRVLPRPSASQDAAWWETGKRRRRRPSVGSAVQAHLQEQVAELVARDPHTRRNTPDALHKMRVATRRLRSALATFRPLLERELTDPLRDELRWLAGVLGAARDAEVMHARLRRLVAAEPGDLVLGNVRDRIDVLMTARHRTAHDAVLEALDGERYLRLLDALEQLVDDPPFLPEAGEDAAAALPRLVRRTWRRLDRTMSAAERAAPGPEQEELLHEVRKEAKRSRYAAEAVQPVVGRPARRYAAAVTELQETLGDVQDGVVTRQVLRELGARGHPAGEDGFTFGRLHALEQVRAEAAVARWPQARAAVSRPRLRRWLAQ
jgi:CHAD domain-containing protein